ncbi:hypothetical protein V1478_001340 [Vespula squamosa]|uniref:Uncharacterized protein n=1 Tax=Vespula squamosa TaxID=30214 RepID=A0ABD2C160_VESSQ
MKATIVTTAAAAAADEFISQCARVIRVQTQQRYFLSAFLSLLVRNIYATRAKLARSLARSWVNTLECAAVRLSMQIKAITLSREVGAGWSKELKRARSTEAEARLSRRKRPFRRKGETEQDGNGSVDRWK